MADGKPTAVNAPGVDGQRIDIGWDRPVSMQEIAQIAGRRLGQRIRVRGHPSRVDQYSWGGGGSVQPDGQGPDRNDALVPDRPVRRRPDSPGRRGLVRYLLPRMRSAGSSALGT